MLETITSLMDSFLKHIYITNKVLNSTDKNHNFFKFNFKDKHCNINISYNLGYYEVIYEKYDFTDRVEFIIIQIPDHTKNRVYVEYMQKNTDIVTKITRYNFSEGKILNNKVLESLRFLFEEILANEFEVDLSNCMFDKTLKIINYLTC